MSNEPSWLAAIYEHLLNGRTTMKTKTKKAGLETCLFRVRTMPDKANRCRSESRFALMAYELCSYNIYIAALSELRVDNEGSFHTHSAGFTLFWLLRPSTDRRFSSAEFMVRNSIASKLETSPMGHCDTIISIRISLLSHHNLTLVSVHSPTLLEDSAGRQLLL